MAVPHSSGTGEGQRWRQKTTLCGEYTGLAYYTRLIIRKYLLKIEPYLEYIRSKLIGIPFSLPVRFQNSPEVANCVKETVRAFSKETELRVCESDSSNVRLCCCVDAPPSKPNTPPHPPPPRMSPLSSWAGGGGVSFNFDFN